MEIASHDKYNDINVSFIENELKKENIPYSSVQICKIQASDGTKKFETFRPDIAFCVVSSRLFDFQTKAHSLKRSLDDMQCRSNRRLNIIIILTILLLILFIGGAFFICRQNEKLSDAEYWHEFYKEKFLEIEDEYNFYHKNAVVVTSTGSKYHKFSCSHVANRQILIYDIATALVEGYTPCYDCGYSE